MYQAKYYAITRAILERITPHHLLSQVDAFINTLPCGIKEYMHAIQDWQTKLIESPCAIRYWQEIPSRTQDGRSINGNKSHWACLALTNGWQDRILTTALHTHDHKHYEIWGLQPFSEIDPNMDTPYPELEGEY
ncbi:hypothetical protein [Ktedonospora formicarum]|uniref:Uncharacterized protein n=1 Tax=Ktedonospora formicarum TaxID=2778364 RepID=A0A8J3IE42_9CHLR|nr:hypothetical protein [Ktedonospora formicarum]GHO50329.1 hypothetical protein KSX_84920 [Ktedonospora formicarum]